MLCPCALGTVCLLLFGGVFWVSLLLKVSRGGWDRLQECENSKVGVCARLFQVFPFRSSEVLFVRPMAQLLYVRVLCQIVLLFP
jgi:hypothetical protein